ncbi:MAG: hypothetical protein KDC10_03590 [Calditrichaeota bacterium]|nr:hypothetical protein [Candidatus Cloacimonadota bacterium]MCA9786621.1 hypothetical protein [Candidatus Cloacimonadota bacterium]MCB1046262.1 hypothetical protein [Calditrichota bacterium]MCB9473541.1 hypothetical protein [Candidatus Delongbacteria bacterium]
MLVYTRSDTKISPKFAGFFWMPANSAGELTREEVCEQEAKEQPRQQEDHHRPGESAQHDACGHGLAPSDFN